MAYPRSLDLIVLLLLTTEFSLVFPQSISIGNSVMRSLEGLGCSHFKSIIHAADLDNKFNSTQPLTVFVFNDTSYFALEPSKRDTLYDARTNTRNAAREYVRSFTIPDVALDTSSFNVDDSYQTMSNHRRVLFLEKTKLLLEDVAGGTAGPTRFFCNGAMLVRPNIQAGQHMIHVIDFPIQQQIEFLPLAFVEGDNPENVIYKFYEKFLRILSEFSEQGTVYNYETQVRLPLASKRMTFFLPSDEAVLKIPKEQLGALHGQFRRMLEIVALHIVPNEALYTTVVNHNQGFPSQMSAGRLTFRKNFDREAVYVTGRLFSDNKPVTARLNTANINVLNGVIHRIDSVLGFVYKTAIEEIEDDPATANFENVIRSVRADLRSALTDPRVVVFAPINEAIVALAQIYPLYMRNQSLLNVILEYSLLEPTEELSLTEFNSGYKSLISARSRYNGNRIKLYSEGNETWVEGGYVRARVVKPDIGVTNGLVHQIDAVFGVPTRDIPYLIFCEGRLENTYKIMESLNLDKYMRDPTLRSNQACSLRAGNGDQLSNSGPVPNQGGIDGLCGGGLNRCEFTFFVPNGTAIDDFLRTAHGQKISQSSETRRLRWLFERLITYREKIYLDRIDAGAPRSYYAVNGEEVFIQSGSSSSSFSGQRTSYLMFQGVRAEIIHSDLGATNGVVHIIRSMLYVYDDATRDVSASPLLHASPLGTVFLVLLVVVCHMLRQ